MDYLDEARKVFGLEIDALIATKDMLGDAFTGIVNAISKCKGKVVLCGMGKSGHIAKKISATMASLGTSAFYLHPAEAMHGDLGMVGSDDFVILISQSGETLEVVRLIPSLKIMGVSTAVITSNEKSTLAKECDFVQTLPKVQEACGLNLAPTSSTTAALAYGDALAVVASKIHGFRKEDFALFHPAGSLGKKVLMRVGDVMATRGEIAAVREGTLLSEAIVEMNRALLGAVVVVDGEDRLIGLMTDGDLRRAIQRKIDVYTAAIDSIMTREPQTVTTDILAVQVLQDLKKNNITNYPVVSDEGRLIGIVTLQMLMKTGLWI